MYLLLVLSTVAFVHGSLNLKGSSTEELELQSIKFSTEATCKNITESSIENAWLKEICEAYQNAKKGYKVCRDVTKTLFYCSDPKTCKKNEGLAVYSNQHTCAKCLGNVKGWTLYIFLATLPTTIFFLIVFGCGIKATSAPMNAFVCIIQIGIYSTSVNIEYYKESVSNYCNPAYYTRMLHVTFGVVDTFSIWNLDFFKYSIPQFCIKESLKTPHVLAMEYIVAIYPLVCIAVLYTCIELHDRDFKPLVLLWNPFSWCLSKSCFKNYDPKMSIIEVFATFLLLAYSKLLFTSFNLLGFKTVYTKNLSDEIIYSSSKMAYDTSIPYLGRDHWPFFILAIFILFTFNILPFLLLLLYPTKLFQKALGCCTRVRWHPLHAFADAFQGCYKNGTNGTKDCRYFAALYLLLRALFSITGFFVYTDSPIFTVMFILICHTFSMLFGMIRPYRNDFYNKMDLFWFFLAPLPQLWFGVLENKAGVVTESIVLVLALIYYIFIAIYKALSVFAPRLLQCLKRCLFQKTCLEFCKRNKNGENDYEPINQNNDDDEVFNELDNRKNYQRLGMTITLDGERNQHPYASYGAVY